MSVASSRRKHHRQGAINGNGVGAKVWTFGTAPAGNWRALIHAEGDYHILGGVPNVSAISIDNGESFSGASHDLPAQGWRAMGHDGATFVALATDGTNRAATSPDGLTWTLRSTPASLWLGVAYGASTWVGVGFGLASNYAMTSPDGITWTGQASAPNAVWNDVEYAEGLFVAVGTNAVMTSPDGVTWTSRTPAHSKVWTAITHGKGIFVACSSSGVGDQMMISEDGITWTSISAPDESYNDITFDSTTGLFIACYDGGVADSEDGISWTDRPITPSKLWTAIGANAGRVVMGAATGEVAYCDIS